MSFLRLSRPITRCLKCYLGLALLAASCAAPAKIAAQADLRESIWEGDYEKAVTLANELRSANVGQPGLLELYDLAYEGYFLDQGRSATFADRDMEALTWFNRAQEVAPGSERVAWWQSKTENKLADKHLSIGDEAFLRGDYDEAGAAYRLVLTWVPNHVEAREALTRLKRVLEYREGLGKGYYSDGVRSIFDYRLRAASRDFMATSKYLPDLKRADNRARDTDQMIAVERVGMAEQLEQESLYAAAYNAFRAALELDSNNADAKAGEARLAGEAQAARVLRDARMQIYRHEFEAAIELLDEGQSLTERQGAEFDAARLSILDARLSAAYGKAWNFEHDGSYELAIKAYAELLETTEYYKDAKARKATLEGYVVMAADYYQRAKDAQEPALELEHLRAIEGFWPGYKDIEQRIDRLEE